MQRQRLVLGTIFVLIIAAIVILVKLPLQLGLDLSGGSQLTLQVRPTTEVPEVTPQDLAAVRRVVEKRVNGLGVAESVVQAGGDDKLSVQLPGVSDPAQAERVLGTTAQLEFREQIPGSEGGYQAERTVYDHLNVNR